MNEAPSVSSGIENEIDEAFFLLQPLTTYSTLKIPLESVNEA